jgi:hypothetical protein
MVSRAFPAAGDREYAVGHTPEGLPVWPHLLHDFERELIGIVIISSGVYQLMHYCQRQPFDRDSAGRDNGAASPDLGRTHH